MRRLGGRRARPIEADSTANIPLNMLDIDDAGDESVTRGGPDLEASLSRPELFSDVKG
jgi:hypothetical protein